ncbi:MAG: hypothetical protein EBR23_12605, partial [Planctomycetia bacterium]|nr:hypothetical protein [Planctomycetia bacterium]
TPASRRDDSNPFFTGGRDWLQPSWRPEMAEALFVAGLDWLADRQQADGTWSQPEFTGTGFPQVFYLRYHYYPIYFPLVAICRALAADGRKGWSA